MAMTRTNRAQELCTELFKEIEAPLGEAWISDDAYTDDPAEFLRFVRHSLSCLDESRRIIKRFLKRHEHKM